MLATDSIPSDAAAAAGREPTPPEDAVRLWIDTHVHLHDEHDAEVFLDAANDHFEKAGAGVGVLCLTDVQGTDGFGRLADAGQVGDWMIESAGEYGLRATRGDGRVIGLIAGRQVKCDDGLEVVSIGRPVDLGDGQPFDEAVQAARTAGGLTVLVYGVGKWTGGRGEKIRRLIEDGPTDLAYGDNSGRVGLGEQKLLKLAGAKGRTVLVGSDPLRTGMGQRRAGCWGVVLDVPGGTDFDGGWADRVVDALRAAGPTPTTFGARVGLATGIAQQIGVRLP
ncbi:MAG: hypothetical protein AAGA25_01560 [Planctomycetota bacterium]